MKLRITHETRYEYDTAVSFSPHLLYLRPREHSRQRLHRFELQISPEPTITRVLDPSENEFWQARFPAPSDRLCIQSLAEVENDQTNPFDFLLKDYGQTFPFNYEPVFDFALGPYLARPYHQSQAGLTRWLEVFFPQRPTDTVEMLTQFNTLIYNVLRYERREDRGIQPSLVTLDRGAGACRDFAVLFVELCRTLGLAARFVSGYFYGLPHEDDRTAGAMHAWVEVYLPGAGWKALDPTHGIWCDDRFIAVAHGAQAESVNPVQGEYYSASPTPARLTVKVAVTKIG